MKCTSCDRVSKFEDCHESGCPMMAASLPDKRCGVTINGRGIDTSMTVESEDDLASVVAQIRKGAGLVASSAGARTFAICLDHQNAEWNQPELEGTSCVLCRLFYLEAQESLLEEWQQRAKRAEDAIKEIERPLDDQMARLNDTVVRLNGEVERYRQGMANWKATAEAKDRVASSATLASIPKPLQAFWGGAGGTEPGGERECIARVVDKIEKHFTPMRCDSMGSSDCIRCGAVYLAGVLKDMLKETEAVAADGLKKKREQMHAAVGPTATDKEEPGT